MFFFAFREKCVRNRGAAHFQSEKCRFSFAEQGCEWRKILERDSKMKGATEAYGFVEGR